MNFVDRAAAERVIDPLALVDYMEACHRQARAAAGDILLLDPQEGSGASFLCRAAWRSGRALGIKFGPIMPKNAAKNLPTIITVVAIFEGETGQPVALIDGHPVTNWKTAADSALAQRHLARTGAKRLLMIGAGTVAPYLVKGHLAVRPSLTEVAVWNRSPARGEAMVADLRRIGIEAELESDLEQAVRRADIISTATLAEAPLVRGAWLRPGQHLDLVGSFLPNMREADKAAVTAGRLFVDTRDGTVGRCGEIIDAGEAAIEGDLYDIAQGKARRSAEEITVFKNAGGGHLDLMTAEFIAQRMGLFA
ncbi:MAG TPA: ornithine cyclodeaminase family protein [Kiloniellales bacterium]|nr:ornithine cyclodeaminase family protein [Kiloniellales bacterium]